MGTTRYIVQFTRDQLLALGLLGCSGCTEATDGHYTHPPNNHFNNGRGSCAQCKCQKFVPKIRHGKEVQAIELRKKKNPDDPTIQYADMNADMVSIIRRQVEEIGDPYLSIPFLDDCVATLIQERLKAREALLQVKVDYLNKKAKLPMKTHAMIENVLVKR